MEVPIHLLMELVEEILVITLEVTQVEVRTVLVFGGISQDLLPILKIYVLGVIITANLNK
jgi:hypothetical protein